MNSKHILTQPIKEQIDNMTKRGHSERNDRNESHNIKKMCHSV
jgi:hypothetical protein